MFLHYIRNSNGSATRNGALVTPELRAALGR